jgi:cell wall-associated NlpC family hydrolase
MVLIKARQKLDTEPMNLMISIRKVVSLSALVLLSACGIFPVASDASPTSTTKSAPAEQKSPSASAKLPTSSPASARISNRRQDVLMYTMGLLGTGYRFGGKNPEAGLDCSGMVSFIYREAAELPMPGNAATLARGGRLVSAEKLLPGDLVFFNTQQRAHSHVGIFIGEGRFVHAPSTNGKIRVDRLDHGYFASRYEEARTYFD